MMKCAIDLNVFGNRKNSHKKVRGGFGGGHKWGLSRPKIGSCGMYGRGLLGSKVGFCGTAFLVAGVTIFSGVTSVNSESTHALSYESQANVGFTVNETINIQIDGDLAIPDLTPGDSAESAPVDVKVSTNAISGYTLSAKMGTNSADLSLAGTGFKFTGLSTSANESTLADNTWGYKLSEDGGSTWSNYSGLPLDSGEYKQLVDKNAQPAGGSETAAKIMIGANAGAGMPAGNYTNVITFYAVAKAAPEPTTSTMQDFSCSSLANVGDSTQLEDSRDGKLYWVTKLADGNCWMTQNLDAFLTTTDGGGILGIDGTTVTQITPENSNVSATWTPQNTTKTASAGSWSSVYDSAYSYDPGDQYFVTSGSTSNDTKYTSLSECTTASNSQEVCEHGHNGNYYNWYAATAGSDASTMSSGQEAPQSICPKGWRLPYGGYSQTGSKSWLYMLSNSIANYGSNAATSQAMRTDPFYIPRAGEYNGSVYYAGADGEYWSSTAGGEAREGDYRAYWLYLNSWYVHLQDDGGRASNGYSVRCVAL